MFVVLEAFIKHNIYVIEFSITFYTARQKEIENGLKTFQILMISLIIRILIQNRLYQNRLYQNRNIKDVFPHIMGYTYGFILKLLIIIHMTIQLMHSTAHTPIIVFHLQKQVYGILFVLCYDSYSKFLDAWMIWIINKSATFLLWPYCLSELAQRSSLGKHMKNSCKDVLEEAYEANM